MSDKGADSSNGNAAADVGPQFSEREMQILAYAFRSLKSGPPEIDYEKLASFTGMTNPRSASNAWAKIKNKLLAGNEDGAAPSPRAKAGSPKKKAVAKAKKDDSTGDADGNTEDVPVTPKKTTTPRKRAPKKQEVDGETSPKKRGRQGAKAKSADVIKEEVDEEEADKGMGEAEAEGNGDVEDNKVDAATDTKEDAIEEFV